MLSNLHTHTSFCDGSDTAEETVLAAIDKGFASLGFSSHAKTDFDLSYCLRDTDDYINEIKRLKEKYKQKIQIYLGTEEDIFQPADRMLYDYIISSSHYILINGQYYPLDLSFDALANAIDTFGGSPLDFAEKYFEAFCDFVLKRKPDIIGHFDLITKYDEKYSSYFSHDKKYVEIAEKYIKTILKSQSLIEVNTGAVSRGLKASPYPAENLLYVVKKENGSLILSSDSHSTNTLDAHFAEARKMLFDIGFRYVYCLYDGEYKKDFLH